VSAADAQPVTIAEARRFFAPLKAEPVMVIAVSGGPDSTALLWLASRWRAQRKHGPELVAVTVDHGLRAESKHEAEAVKRFAQGLGIAHRTLHWRGTKPKAGIQEAARLARYALIAGAARKAGARSVLTAHTLDDQAETVLIRLLRGSGPSGLQAMTERASYPGAPDLSLVRPLLSVPKARLVATLRKAGIGFAEDPSNRDPRYTRARLRGLFPALAAEGLTAERLATLARRLQRAEEALRVAVDEAAARVLIAPVNGSPGADGRIIFDREAFLGLPAEIALRLLGQAVTRAGYEGPVELGKLEALFEALREAGGSAFRRTLAGAMVTCRGGQVVVESAPARRAQARKVAKAPHSGLNQGENSESGRGRNTLG
jgi:tRNA(Ile)-lysidine synthase